MASEQLTAPLARQDGGIRVVRIDLDKAGGNGYVRESHRLQEDDSGNEIQVPVLVIDAEFEVISATCRNCKHWDVADVEWKHVAGFGLCSLAWWDEAEEGNRRPDLTKMAMGHGREFGELMCKADFGCVQFEAVDVSVPHETFRGENVLDGDGERE